MGIADYCLKNGAGLFRSIPYFRGFGRIYRVFNDLMIRFGASPIVIAEMHDGYQMRVDLRSGTERNVYYQGKYDQKLVDTVCLLLGPDGVFLDVGANVGFYTVAVANFIRRNGGSGFVYSFEPLSANYERMMENIEMNRLGNYCSVSCVGLSNLAKIENLVLREDFQSGATTGNASIAISERFDLGFPRTKVQLNTLDAIWPKLHTHTNIDVIKIDIEGHEDLFLEGARNVIQKIRPTILMEVNKPYYEARRVALSRLLTFIPDNYRIYRRSDEEWRMLDTLDTCDTVDNVFLVPVENLVLDNYRPIRSQHINAIEA